MQAIRKYSRFPYERSICLCRVRIRKRKQARRSRNGRQVYPRAKNNSGVCQTQKYKNFEPGFDQQYFTMHPRIYIGRVNGKMKKNDILDLFSKYGEIVDLLMKEDFAFIEYQKSESAQLAIKEMNGYLVPGTQVRLVVEGARPKSPEECKKIV